MIALAAVYWGTLPLAVQFHTRRARQFLDQHDNQRALDQLRIALRLAPERAETRFLLARAHRRLGNLDRVEPLLRHAEKLGGDPDRAQRETWLARAQAGRLREAEPHLSNLLMDTREDGAEICAAYVQGYLTNLQPREALQLLDAWQNDYPGDPQSHFLRGDLNQALALWGEAAESYRRGLELAPGRTPMRVRLAEVLGERNENDEAIRQFQRCAGETPNNAALFAAWAQCLVRQGHTDQARPILQRALSIASMHFEALRQLGELELAEGNFRAALPPLQAAASQRPYDSTTRNALGKTLQALGKADEAGPHLEYAAAAEESLSRMKRELRRVVERPTDPDLRYDIGATLLRYGSPPDGAKWLHTVLELDPNHQAAHRALAAYYQSVGNLAQAARHEAQVRESKSRSALGIGDGSARPSRSP
jgi:tetratricopeptide (TPR) repeat protein